jgi:glycosyltransferase involved in cell wall biosynthesis
VVTSQALHDAFPGPLDIRSVNWFVPPFTHPYFGGIYTILRFANYLKEVRGVASRFVVVGPGGFEAKAVQAAIGEAFPALRDAELCSINHLGELGRVGYADASIATLWSTAYFVLKFAKTKRKFYFLQDYEPLFYPAGSISGQCEATYRFGFYGIANTVSLKTIYERDYRGVATHFSPCVDTDVFYPRRDAAGARPLRRVFFYGRPDQPRNGFELGSAALRRLKASLGERVHIVAAGGTWEPRHYDLEGVVENLGILSYHKTAALYRNCDVGLVLMFTRHPSYLPFEFMASGCLVVTNRNEATSWLLRDGENCLLAEPSVECLAEALHRGLTEPDLHRRITDNALNDIRAKYADWTGQMANIYQFMCHPSAHRSRVPQDGQNGEQRIIRLAG